MVVLLHFSMQNGAFHRNAGHVLQAQASTDLPGGQKGLAFQEYHPDFPHKQYTMGYAGTSTCIVQYLLFCVCRADTCADFS